MCLGYLLISLKTHLRWSTSLFTRFSFEHMVWVLRTSVLNVPFFHVLGAMSPSEGRYRYWWVCDKQKCLFCLHHVVESIHPGKRFFWSFSSLYVKLMSGWQLLITLSPLCMILYHSNIFTMVVSCKKWVGVINHVRVEP